MEKIASLCYDDLPVCVFLVMWKKISTVAVVRKPKYESENKTILPRATRITATKEFFTTTLR